MSRFTGKKTLEFLTTLGFIAAPDFNDRGDAPNTFFSYIFYFKNDEAFTIKATIRRSDNTLVRLNDTVVCTSFINPDPVRRDIKDTVVWDLLQPYLLQEVK